MKKGIFANVMKLKDIGVGAKFIRVKEEDKYLYSKVKYAQLNAIRLYDGRVYYLDEEENVICIIT